MVETDVCVFFTNEISFSAKSTKMSSIANSKVHYMAVSHVNLIIMVILNPSSRIIMQPKWITEI